MWTELLQKKVGRAGPGRAVPWLSCAAPCKQCRGRGTCMQAWWRHGVGQRADPARRGRSLRPRPLLPQKAPGIIGKAAETEGQRALRLYDSLQDFGESDLVIGWVADRNAWRLGGPREEGGEQGARGGRTAQGCIAIPRFKPTSISLPLMPILFRSLPPALPAPAAACTRTSWACATSTWRCSAPRVGAHPSPAPRVSARPFGFAALHGAAWLPNSRITASNSLQPSLFAASPPAAVLHQLGDADAFMRACHRRGEFALLKYVPAPLVALSSLVAGPDRCAAWGGRPAWLLPAWTAASCSRSECSPTEGSALSVVLRMPNVSLPPPGHCRPNLQWPRAGFDAQRRAAANRALLQGWMLGMSPAVCAAASSRRLVLESGRAHCLQNNVGG